MGYNPLVQTVNEQVECANCTKQEKRTQKRSFICHKKRLAFLEDKYAMQSSSGNAH